MLGVQRGIAAGILALPILAGGLKSASSVCESGSLSASTLAEAMPTPRSYLSVAVIDGNVYAVGGIDGLTANNYTATNIVEVYDLASDPGERS